MTVSFVALSKMAALSVPGGLVSVDVRFGSEVGIHWDCSADVLNGQYDQSPSGSVVCPTSIR